MQSILIITWSTLLSFKHQICVFEADTNIDIWEFKTSNNMSVNSLLLYKHNTRICTEWDILQCENKHVCALWPTYTDIFVHTVSVIRWCIGVALICNVGVKVSQSPDVFLFKVPNLWKCVDSGNVTSPIINEQKSIYITNIFNTTLHDFVLICI